MTRILVRADGSSQQGLGHLFRALSLAEMIDPGGRRKAGEQRNSRAEPPTLLFFTTCDFPAIHAMLRERGFEPHLITDEVEWLGWVRSGDVVVMDGYHFSLDLQRQVRGLGATLVVVDDLADRHQVADVVVNHAPFFDKPYSCEEYTRLCIGSQYAILRSEFVERGLEGRAYVAPRGILVAFGGADPLNLTQKYLPALAQAFPDEPVQVILGAGYTEREALEKATSASNVVLHSNLSAQQLYQLLIGVRVAILPASTMAMEAIACRTPVLAGWFVDNQHELYLGLRKSEAILDLGDFRTLDAASLVNHVQETLAALPQGLERKLDALMYKFIDGNSWRRIRQAVEAAQHLRMRKATPEDVDLYFRWANEPAVRASSFHSEEIPYENHVAWYAKRMQDASSHLFLFEWDGVPCGQVRIQDEAEGAIVGISLDEQFRGRGLSPEMLVRACAAFFRVSKTDRIIAYIKYDNKASQNAFLAAGFQLEGDSVVNGVGGLRMVLRGGV
jgi:spore coat polysaccharide biosynthesis predicted glycosyltransferase SpsG/RimJ/RimL family protein N-acetyltransferase